MSLVNKLKQFCLENTTLIFVLVFFSVLGYGYFITNWSISSDSEVLTFQDFFIISMQWIVQGRFLIPILNFLDNFHIIPFWNDFISVCLLLLSFFIWMITIQHNKRNSLYSQLVFGLLFVISPIYAFYLRITIYNISVSVGILFISLSLYYLVEYFNCVVNRKTKFLLSYIYLLLAICIYQMFVVYYITALLFIVLANALGNDDYYSSSLKNIIIKLLYGSAILFASLCMYKVISIVVYHFIPASGYPDSLIQWSKAADITAILYGLKAYFRTVLIEQKFNFFILFTLICSMLYMCYLLIINYRNIHIVLLMLLFVVSPFIMPLAFGYPMPLRTLQPVPLMVAGIWVLFCYGFNKQIISKIILSIVIICSFYNAQYINMLFYGDNMRLEYDKNFANQLYSYVISNTGDSIKSKPLIILGKHSYSDRPFILKSLYDTFLGYYFFELDVGNQARLYYFMQWLGDDYIAPTNLEQESAVQLSFDMPNYPAKGSLKETESFIILKLSSSFIDDNQPPIKLDLRSYSKLSKESVASCLDNLDLKNNKLNYRGWAYIKQFDANKTNMFIKFVSEKNDYIFPVNPSDRIDVAEAFKDGINLKNAGFYGTLNNHMEKGNYRVLLILINGEHYAEVNLGKSITIN